MARLSKSKTLAELEGKLGAVRQDVLEFLRGLKREIAKREEEITALKAELAKGTELLSGRAAPVAASARSQVRRARQINWKDVFRSLPERFTLKALVQHPVAGRRPKGHLYAILSRWKKEGMLTKDSTGSYRKPKAEPTPKPKAKTKAPRSKPSRAEKRPAASQAPSA